MTPQGITIKEIDEALKTASKSVTGNVGFPEYVDRAKILIVIDDKVKLSFH